MNTLNDRQRATLERGLAAFDAASRHRRVRRYVVRTTAAAVLVVACAWAARVATVSEPSRLPGYVELVRDDRQLAAELEFANACERVNRTGGRLVVVECMVP
jgi:hypothetical protein